MTVTLFASGIATGTIGSEQFLTNVNQAGQFTGYIDVSNMQNGDTLELRAYQTILTGGTARVVDFLALYGAQLTDQLIMLWGAGLVNDLTDAQSLRYSIKQTFGTVRQYNWKVTNNENFPSNFMNFIINSVGQVVINSGTLSSSQNFNLIGNISGSMVGTVQAVQGGTVSVSGTVVSSAVQGGFVTVSGTVVVGTNNDKTNYSLANNQVINVSGTITNVMNVINPVTVGTNNDKTGYTLTSVEEDTIASKVWATVIETGYTALQLLRLVLSSTVAKLSGAATTTVKIRDINDTKDRITATVDSDGNRTNITTDVS